MGIFKDVYGATKHEYLLDEAIGYYESHTVKEAHNKYGLSGTTITKGFKMKYGVTKTEYLKQQKLKGLA